MKHLLRASVCAFACWANASFRIVASIVVCILLAGRCAQADLVTVPTDLGPNAQYRLAFLTSQLISGDSTNIAVYNNFVTASANAVSELGSLGTTWRAIVSTPTMDARVNTVTLAPFSPSVPIYLLDGSRIAGGNNELWDGSLATFLNITELGTVVAAATVWTGTNRVGAADAPLGTNSPRRGATNLLNSGWINIGPTPDPNSSLEHLYALSGVLTVPQTSAVPEPTSIAMLGLTVLGAGLVRRGRKRASTTTAESHGLKSLGPL
jgi:hypothetical protein